MFYLWNLKILKAIVIIACCISQLEVICRFGKETP